MAGPAGDGRRGRGGNAGPPAPERPDRTGRHRADSVLQPGRAGAGGRLPRPPAGARRWRAWPLSGGTLAAARAGRPPRGCRSGARGRRAGDLAWRWWWWACRSRSGATSGPSTRASPPSRSGPWLGDVAQVGRASARSSPRIGGALVIWLDPPLPGALVDPVGRRGRGLRRAHPLPVAGGDRPALQQVRAAARGASCAPTCCAWPTAPGVDVGEVYRVDASRRTTAVNAYVGGLGHTKRVVLYDNLIEDFPPDQVRSVVAHELGHVVNDDVPEGPAVDRDRRARGHVPGPAADRADRGRGRLGGGARPDGRALPARGAVARAGELRAHLRRQRAVAPGRGARRRLRARDHRATRRRSSSWSAA